MNPYLDQALSQGFAIEHLNNARYIAKPLNEAFSFLMRIEKDQIVAPQIFNNDAGEVDNDLVDELLTRIMNMGSKPEGVMQKVALFYSLATVIIESKMQMRSA